ncbi:MAG: 50S ribosomal protein L5 [Dehalococcoidia bacterium]|nr:50S ribosomal protein L5 [Dehalococcoidia bacterium]
MSEVQGDDRLEEAPSPAGESTADNAAASTETGAEQAQPAKARAPRSTPRAARGTSTRSSSARASRAAAAAPATEEEAPAASPPPQASPTPRLKELYQTEVVPAMLQEFGYKNVVQVPKLKKVVLNIGLGEALTNPRAMESATKDLSTISGQKPIITRAKKSIAGFKLREGNPIGMCVTLRGARMYQFMDRLLNAALPRIRDFRGVPATSFDGRGNYSLGIREQIIFPEIDYGQIERIRGLQITINTTARTDSEASRLLALMGMPFVRQN